MMVDMLQQQAPGLFTNMDSTFIDLYSKSGLYMTEIIKRLFIGLKDGIPDETERVQWIMEEQVFACAPSDIIYNMVKNYVYGGFPGVSTNNLLKLDLIPAAKEGRLAQELQERMGKNVKFDAIVGNPPYQEETAGTSDNQIYYFFMEDAYNLSDLVCLITPARFLFNAGKTPKWWNKKMLEDEHIKVVFYEQDSGAVFPGPIDIKGGVAITIRDKSKVFGSIGPFIPNEQLRNVLNKVRAKTNDSISSLIYSPESYKFTDMMHMDYPDAEKLLSSGHKYDITTNIMEKLDFIFVKKEPRNKDEYVQLYGLLNRDRIYRWIKRSYLNEHENLYSYKVIMPKASGSGDLGEVLSSPEVLSPGVGHTQTFISIGKFKTGFEANSLLNYIRTKFVRALLGTLKITQDVRKEKWTNVPLQDFTLTSDITWTKSIDEIDQQLYAKYGLTEEEIAFIESMIRPMSANGPSQPEVNDPGDSEDDED